MYIGKNNAITYHGGTHGLQVQLYRFFNLCARKGDGRRHASSALAPRKSPITGGCVGLGASVVGWKESRPKRRSTAKKDSVPHCILWNTNIHCRVQNSHVPAPVLSYTNSLKHIDTP